jgi:ABC-type antimicrobial peptide transport system permease subunit
MVIRIQTASEVGSIAARIGNWLRPVDPQLFWELDSMQAQIHDSESLTLRRPMIALLASFGTLGMVLVIVGIFGVTSYSVAERTREVGIRVALGATRGEIAALVLREVLAIALVGLGVGTFGAFALTRFLPTQGIGWSGSGIFLYGISRTDVPTYALSGVLLIGVVLAACWLPAGRAARVDPMVSLRYE